MNWASVASTAGASEATGNVLAHLGTALFLTVPLVVSGAFHMLVVRRNWLRSLRRPIHESSFGPNKTWRGVVVMILATIPGASFARWLEGVFQWRLLVSFQEQPAVLLGAALGLAYVLGELPNSYVKRRLKIEPGMLPAKNRLLFAFVDQADSAFACAIVYVLMFQVPIVTLVIMCLIGPAIHLVANVTLFLVGLRARPV
jgi:CDP-diacylglycerol--serine O-phosphatidyltransferase